MRYGEKYARRMMLQAVNTGSGTPSFFPVLHKAS